jgi:aminoglycoside/choline kinase family phosphotransferase
MPERLQLLHRWLQQQKIPPDATVTPITNDASFRRYFRVMIQGVPHIIMDAPPEKEDCHPFVEIARRLRASGLNAPQVLSSDFQQGFLLLTDLGSQLYLPLLQQADADKLYREAIAALVTMQRQTATENLPEYDAILLHREMRLFTDWLLAKHLNLQLTDAEKLQLSADFELLARNALFQPQVFVHRDYHSRNLMYVPAHNPGILDFQDAVRGAITYDLVSLLRDCYIAWSAKQVHEWTHYYYQLATEAGLLAHSESQFLHWFDRMGIQRHLKASGIFARLWHRDGKAGYLPEIPRTLRYIVDACAADRELQFLGELVAHRVFPALEVIH